jgi:hypothetical protein
MTSEEVVQMETAMPIDDFVTSDISFSARFDSRPITLDDAAALLQLLKAILDAAQAEIHARLGEDIEILPVVRISRGSVDVHIEVKKGGDWSLHISGKVREIFLAIGLLIQGATGGSTAIPSLNVPPPPPLSATCEETITREVQSAHDVWKYRGKDFTASIEVSCGNTTVKSEMKSPPSHH